MSEQGILERIETQLQALTVMVGALGAQAPAVAETPAAPGAPSPNLEVDSAGHPWDARIHQANKGITNTGKWKKKKGADKNLIAQLEAQWNQNQPSGVTTPPGAPAAPAPTAPGAPTVTPGTENPAKTAAQAAINLLTTEFDIPYDKISDALKGAFAVNLFNDLNEAQFESAKNLYERWVEDARESIEAIDRIYALGAEQGQAGVNQTLANFGVSAINLVGYDRITELKNLLVDYCGQWEDYAGTQQ